MKRLLVILLFSCSVFADEIPFENSRGTFNVPITLNGKMTLNAIIDSGAAELFIPEDIIRTLVRMDTIGEEDMLENGQYAIADGSIKERERVNIKELKIGQNVLYNVSVVVGESDGEILIGQNLLQHFSNWSIDNKKQVFILGSVQEVQPKPIQPKDKPVLWIKDIENGVVMIATNRECAIESIKNDYQFLIYYAIPIERLKNPDDAYFLVSDNKNAVTVRGCWSPTSHTAIYYRKQDGKEWAGSVRVDDTWTKIE